MDEWFVAEVRIFFGNFAPQGWACCDGQIEVLSQNTALFSLLGTTYGGNGKSNFALPNLSGRVPLHPSEEKGINLGEEGGGHTVRKSKQRSPKSSSPTVARKANSKSQESLVKSQDEFEDATARAVAKLKRVADELTETHAQTQQLIKVQAHTLNHIKEAATHVRDFQSMSMKGESGDAGAALKALFQSVDELNRDPHSLPELEKALARLRESQEHIREMIAFQTDLVSNINSAAECLRNYQTKVSKGELRDAGGFLETLIQTIYELEHMWDEAKSRPALATLPQPDHSWSPGGMKTGSHSRFFAVNFCIATQGIFPPRA